MASLLSAADLKQKTVDAFESYIRAAEARIGERTSGIKSFLWLDDTVEYRAKARGGEIVIGYPEAGNMTKVPGGLIHDWIGGAFLPGVTLRQVLAFVQNYDCHKEYYGPEVTDSKLLARNGDDFKIFYRLRKKKVITVILDTEHEVHYFPATTTRAWSRSRAMKIAEVKNAGKPDERELPPGHDGGYLWRLNSYWRFEERDGGVWMELEAISLTRGIPFGLGWLVKPIVRDLPRESLTATLVNTRKALVK